MNAIYESDLIRLHAMGVEATEDDLWEWEQTKKAFIIEVENEAFIEAMKLVEEEFTVASRQ